MPRPVQLLLASLIALFAGFFGLVFLFSDTMYGTFETASWYTIHFFLPGLLIGMLFPRAWYVAALVAWAPVFSVVGGVILPMGMPDRPAVQVTIREGSIDVNPAVIQLPASREFFDVDIRNEGGSVHEIILIPVDEREDLQTLAANLDLEKMSRARKVFFGMPPLGPGETSKASVEMIGTRMALLCSVPGHTLQGEVGELRREP